MATEGNVRHLRYILLLDEGGLLILRAILEGETNKTGVSLDELLKQEKQSLHAHVSGKARKEQDEKLYPQTGNVNINTWDISLLGKVIVCLFGNTSLSNESLSDINHLKGLRNKYSHPASVSMESDEFENAWKELAALLIKLSSDLDDDVHDRCQNFVKQFHTGPIDAFSATERLKEISKFNEILAKQLKALTRRVEEVSVKVDTNTDKLQEIKQLLIQQKEDIHSLPVVGAKVDFIGPNDNLTNLADTVITRVFTIALEQIDVAKPIPELNNEETLKLKGAVEQILQVIEKIGGKVCAFEKKCIVMKIKCASSRGLLNLLEYLESEEFKQRLLDIAGMLKENFNCVYHITFGITQDSLENILDALTEEQEMEVDPNLTFTAERQKNEQKLLLLETEESIASAEETVYLRKGKQSSQTRPKERDTEEMLVGSDATENVTEGPMSVSIRDENNTLVEDIIKLLESPDRKYAEVILLIGKSGAGKSALINTIHKALTGFPIAKEGKGEAATLSMDLNRYANCGVLSDSIEREGLKGVHQKLPHIYDCAGLANEYSARLSELLELLIGGYIGPKISILTLENLQDSLGIGALKRIFHEPNPELKVTKIVFMQGCIDAIPRNLIECLRDVLKIYDVKCFFPKYQCGVFVMITKYDLVKDAEDSHLYGQPGNQSLTLEELEQVEKTLEEEFNYTGNRDVSRMHSVCCKDDVGSDNPYIDNMALKFLKRMIEPGVPRVENPTPVVHTRMWLHRFGNMMSGFLDIRISLPKLLIVVAILIAVLAGFYIFPNQAISSAKNGTD